MTQKDEDSLRELKDNLKHNNIHITEIPEVEEKDKVQKTCLNK